MECFMVVISLEKVWYCQNYNKNDYGLFSFTSVCLMNINEILMLEKIEGWNEMDEKH